MARILFFTISIVFFIGCGNIKNSKTPNKTAKPKELKVMVWNILRGGHDKYLPADGRPDIIQIIKDSKADVVLMIETYGSAPMIAKGIGYNYELISSNLCIYSRYPITKRIEYPEQISTFNFGGVEIDVKGQKVALFDTWLHYLPDTRLAPVKKSEEEILSWEHEGTRDEEITKILQAINSYTKNTDSIPVIMGGDFNSHSHLDWTENTKNMYNHGGAVVNWKISRAMTDAGFKDTFREIHPDPAKEIGTTWLSDVKKNKEDALTFNRRDRIDYLYSKGITIKDSEFGVAPIAQEFMYKGRKYDHFPSDHGFVVTTFELK